MEEYKFVGSLDMNEQIKVFLKEPLDVSVVKARLIDLIVLIDLLKSSNGQRIPPRFVKTLEKLIKELDQKAEECNENSKERIKNLEVCIENFEECIKNLKVCIKNLEVNYETDNYTIDSVSFVLQRIYYALDELCKYISNKMNDAVEKDVEKDVENATASFDNHVLDLSKIAQSACLRLNEKLHVAFNDALYDYLKTCTPEYKE